MHKYARQPDILSMGRTALQWTGSGMTLVLPNLSSAEFFYFIYFLLKKLILKTVITNYLVAASHQEKAFNIFSQSSIRDHETRCFLFINCCIPTSF
jgi:hypothetical protein